MIKIERVALSDVEAVQYDRQHLALYAALIEAADLGRTWQQAAIEIMHLDVSQDDAETCWRSHLDRARWIVSEGLESAISVFGRRPQQ